MKCSVAERHADLSREDDPHPCPLPERQITLDEQRLRAFCEGLEMGDIEQALQQPPEFWFAYGQTKHELEKDHAAKARAWELEHKTMKVPHE